MNKHERRLQLAMRMAYKARVTRAAFRTGCAIFKKGRVVGVGANDMLRTHPRSKARFHHVHAELDAILGVDAENLRGSIAYVTRAKHAGPGMAKPCQHCMDLLNRVGVKKVFYTDYDGSVRCEVVDV